MTASASEFIVVRRGWRAACHWFPRSAFAYLRQTNEVRKSRDARIGPSKVPRWACAQAAETHTRERAVVHPVGERLDTGHVRAGGGLPGPKRVVAVPPDEVPTGPLVFGKPLATWPVSCLVEARRASNENTEC